MKSKKSQARMFETIAVIVVFFMMLAVGFIFYTKLQRSSIQEKIRTDSDTRAMKIARTAINMPELQCNGKTYCIDTLQIEAFKDALKDPKAKSDYYDTLKSSKITVKKIYPPSSGSQPITIYNREKQDPTASKQSIWMPIALFDPVGGKTHFAILTVDVYD